MSILENRCLTPVNVYPIVYTMDDDEMAGNEAYCETCSEREVIDALDEVHVATQEWHRVVRYVHPECRELFVASNLPAVLASLRLVAL